MKVKLGLIFGGKSAEHEVSIHSAKAIVNSIDRTKYELILIAINKNGEWFLVDDEFANNETSIEEAKLKIKPENKIALIPVNDSNQIIKLNEYKLLGNLDIAFSIVHGTIGEDGGLQGFFNVLNLPFVGCDILGSAVGMDKDVSKRLLNEAGIAIAKFKVVHLDEIRTLDYHNLTKELNWPLFIKPSNAGSSVGVHKASNIQELEKAIENALQFDSKVIVEEFIEGREIECSVLGNEDIIASVPGEIITQHDFYSYKAKYIDKNGAILKMPAELPEDIVIKIKTLAQKTFKVLCGKGLARIDFFLTPDNNLVVNEVNTLPGFTSISMYPKLLGLTGISYNELIDRLITLGFEHHKKKQQMLNSINEKKQV